MAQYLSRIGFATKVDTVDSLPMTNTKSAIIYIGDLIDPFTGGASLTVRPVGNTTDVTFNGLTSGSFLPVEVSKITSASNVSLSNILLIY
jgi:hypothetical protein